MSRNDLQPYPVNVTLSITQEDIDFGIAQDSASCAIAHAIYRTFPDALRVRVNKKKISWSSEDSDVRYVYPTPPTADTNIIKPFDLKQPVKPRRITLTGGQFRGIDHHNTRQAREQARELKRTDPESYNRRFGHANRGTTSASRIYERYVPDKASL